MKICIKCDQEKPNDQFLRYGESRYLSACKTCRNIETMRLKAVREAKERELARIEAQRLIETRMRDGVALPMTHTTLKDPECWTGHTERYYVRNGGNKHIPSRGFA